MVFWQARAERLHLKGRIAPHGQSQLRCAGGGRVRLIRRVSVMLYTVSAEGPTRCRKRERTVCR